MRRRTLTRLREAVITAALLGLALTFGVAHATPAPRSPQGATQATPAPPSSVPNLAGRWELNVQASDPPPEATGASGEGDEGRRGGGAPGGRGGGGTGGGMGRGGGGMGGDPGRGVESQKSSAVREEMRRVLEAPRLLLIVQHEASLSLTDEEGRVLSLKPDAVKVKEQRAGSTTERTTRWDGRSLVTSTKLSGGAKVTQTFTKIAEGLQLLVVTKVEGGRTQGPMEIKRVYDQALQVS